MSIISSAVDRYSAWFNYEIRSLDDHTHKSKTLNMILNFTEFTIPVAVNLIVAVDDGYLQELGRKLGVDDARLRRLSSYDASERHQRLIEAWFEQKTGPSRSALVEALPRRDSSVSMSSVPPTPTSDSHSGKKGLRL